MEGERGGGLKAIGATAMETLGLGFDLASDFRLKFAKKCPDSSDGRLVVLDHSNPRDVVLPAGGGGGGVISNVPECIRCDKGDRIRFKSDVLTFNQVILTYFFVFCFGFVVIVFVIGIE